MGGRYCVQEGESVNCVYWHSSWRWMKEESRELEGEGENSLIFILVHIDMDCTEHC